MIKKIFKCAKKTFDKNNHRTFRQRRFATTRPTQHGRTADAHDDRLRVTEHGRDFIASRAFDIHEEAVRMLHEPFQFVRTTLGLRVRMQ
jgi:hypothetical protein